MSTTDVIMIQMVATKTGAASRLGIASLDPTTIGSSTNPGYPINVSQPVSAQAKSWGSLKALYHNWSRTVFAAKSPRGDVRPRGLLALGTAAPVTDGLP